MVVCLVEKPPPCGVFLNDLHTLLNMGWVAAPTLDATKSMISVEVMSQFSFFMIWSSASHHFNLIPNGS